MNLAAALLLVVFLCHFGYDLAALNYVDRSAAARAFFYIFRGVEGTVLFAAVAVLARNRWVLAVCAFGMFEEGETAICRAAKPIAERPAIELFTGLCGEPWYGVGLFIALLLAVELADRLRKERA